MSNCNTQRNLLSFWTHSTKSVMWLLTQEKVDGLTLSSIDDSKLHRKTDRREKEKWTNKILVKFSIKDQFASNPFINIGNLSFSIDPGVSPNIYAMITNKHSCCFWIGIYLENQKGKSDQSIAKFYMEMKNIVGKIIKSKPTHSEGRFLCDQLKIFSQKKHILLTSEIRRLYILIFAHTYQVQWERNVRKVTKVTIYCKTSCLRSHHRIGPLTGSNP